MVKKAETKPAKKVAKPAPMEIGSANTEVLALEGATVELGDQLRDRVTGFVGIAVAYTVWLNGCVRWMVQGRADKEGKAAEGAFDEIQLEVLVKEKVPATPVRSEVASRETGGPGDGGAQSFARQGTPRR